MKRLVEVSPLNTSSKLAYRCEKCGAQGYIRINPPVNVDDRGEPQHDDRLEGFTCPECGAVL